MFSERNNQRRAQDNEMIDSFFEAADDRRFIKSKAEVVETIRSRNSYRFWRLQHDLKWFKKELRRQGYNPDEFGEFL